MEFLGPLFAMGMFADMHKSSESGESVGEDEMKSYKEFIDNNIEIVDGKFKCKICFKKFNKRDIAERHVGNKHHEVDCDDD